jgi:hypothetical protein
VARLLASLREEALLIADMREKLSDLGYSIVDEQAEPFSQGKPLFFDTRWDEYKVLVRIGEGGELVTRLARIVATEREKAETTDYQRQRDKEVAHSWCHDFDKFIDSLQQQGYAFKSVMRKEPEQEGVICLVDARMAAKRTQSAQLSAPAVMKEKALER